METAAVARPGSSPGSAFVANAYDAWAEDLLRYVTTRTRDVPTAEDIVQEAFVRLTFESRASRIPSNPRAWLYRVVLNLIISASRHREVARRRSPELVRHDVVESPEAGMLALERRAALLMGLQTLGTAGRTSLLLAAEGFTGREIADHLGRSEGATRTIICRARKALRSDLAG
jgi:RNA polymerase sigma-70 factor (ECF subfamily)